jgi:holo-[acyl-carrier protein] synthase
MITGIGIDMIEVARVAKRITKENGFKEKVFSANEIAFCESNKNKAQHYAARFAAKEAFLKAAGAGLTLSYELHEIEIIKDSLGKPYIQLKGILKKMAKKKRWSNIQLSLTHLRSLACAIVIIEE